MGGYGSGLWHRQTKKDTTDRYRTIDVGQLQRDGFLRPGLVLDVVWTRNGERQASIQIGTGPGAVMLSYRHQGGGGDWQDWEYPVRMASTPCHFGGERHWFICPAQGCGRRVALLYLGAGGVFACRHCHGLAYPSQSKPADYRAAARARGIRRRLGWPGGILNPPGSKPKGMHWKTFRRLRSQAAALAEAWVDGRQKWAGRVKRRYAPFVEAMTKAAANVGEAAGV